MNNDVQFFVFDFFSLSSISSLYSSLVLRQPASRFLRFAMLPVVLIYICKNTNSLQINKSSVSQSKLWTTQSEAMVRLIRGFYAEFS